MIPGQELDSTAKLKVTNGVNSMKSLWLDIYILIILEEEKTSTSGIKAAKKKKQLTLTDCPKYQIACRLYKCSFGKRTKKINMNNRRCLSYLTCRLELFPVHFLLPASLINTCFNESAQDVFVRVTAVFLDF